jgi:hypothetical protein
MRCLRVGVGLIAATACAGGTASWSASTWNGLDEKSVSTRNYQFIAAPLDGQGFKLKLTLRPGGNFGVQSAGAPPPQAELGAAATLAAPPGCTVIGVSAQSSGDGIAEYDCRAPAETGDGEN